MFPQRGILRVASEGCIAGIWYNGRRLKRIGWFLVRLSLVSVLPVVGAHAGIKAENDRHTIEFGKSLLKELPKDAVVPCQFEELPLDIRESMGFMAWLLQAEALPFDNTVRPIQPRTDIALSIAVGSARDGSQDDLVIYEWNCKGRRLRVVTSANAMRIDYLLSEVADCTALHDRSCVASVKEWLDATMRLVGTVPTVGSEIEYRVELPWPDQLADGIVFFERAREGHHAFARTALVVRPS